MLRLLKVNLANKSSRELRCRALKRALSSGMSYTASKRKNCFTFEFIECTMLTTLSYCQHCWWNQRDRCLMIIFQPFDATLRGLLLRGLFEAQKNRQRQCCKTANAALNAFVYTTCLNQDFVGYHPTLRKSGRA